METTEQQLEVAAKNIVMGEYFSFWPYELTAAQAFDAVVDAEELPLEFGVWEVHADCACDYYDQFTERMQSLYLSALDELKNFVII